MNKMHTKEEKMAAFSRLLDVQDRLRLQCPWDKKQTFESLRPNTIEETFELCDALMKRDYKDIKKELGDVLEHVMFYSIIGREDGEFDICDVCNQEADKLMFRHPFINWNEEGEWSVSNPDMYINENGQVVYKEEKCESEDSASDDDRTLWLRRVQSNLKHQLLLRKPWNRLSSRRRMEMKECLAVFLMPCLLLLKLIAYRTRQEM